jgi:hypothetical protein
MVVLMMVSYVGGRIYRRPPPLLRTGSRARVYMASLIPRAILLLSLSRYVMSSGRKWWPVVHAYYPMAEAYLPVGGLMDDLALLWCSLKRVSMDRSISPM